METMKNNEKIIKATQEVVKKKETEKLLESMPDFDDEFDEICWCLEHPTSELYSLIKKLDEVSKKLDTSKVKVIDC